MSFSAKTVNDGGFMPTFKIQAQVYHSIGSVLPSYANDHFYKYILLVIIKKKRNFGLIFPKEEPKILYTRLVVSSCSLYIDIVLPVNKKIYQRSISSIFSTMNNK